LHYADSSGSLLFTEILMNLEKPKRAYVTIKDGDTLASKSKTIYGATADQVWDTLLRALRPDDNAKPSRKRTAKPEAA
jgi:hypothetical protein